MIPLETLVLFFAASAALGFAPGPDNIFVLTQSALHGRLAGFVVTLGLCTGLLVHTAAVAIGVAAIFAASALAFTVLKLVGAAYLVYLGVQAFRAAATEPGDNKRAPASLRSLYARGIFMNVTNPKVVIFFLAFLPQFADPTRGSLGAQMLLLGAVFIVATILVFGSVAWGAGHLGDWLRRSPKAQVLMNRLAGLIFVSLALKLATTQR